MDADVAFVLTVKDGKSYVTIEGEGDNILLAEMVGNAMLGQLIASTEGAAAGLPVSSNAIPFVMLVQNAEEVAPKLKLLTEADGEPTGSTEEKA